MLRRAALYTRVSTDIQANKEEGSLETQEARLRAAVASRAQPTEVVRVFREEGASGKSLDRAELQALLAGVRAGDFDLVLVTRIDRLSRSLLDFHHVHKLFQEHGVVLHSLGESFDTSTAVGRAMLNLLLVFAQLEREQTGERTRAAIQARAERGLWNGGHPPLGYESQGNGHLDVAPAEADLVRLIFGKYQELRSVPKVAKWLNEHGHRQKRYTSRRRGEVGGQPYTLAMVRAMLRNRLYLGEIDHKGQIYAGQHDAIIERQQFDHVQTILDGNAKNRRGPPSTSLHDYPLTGLLTCGSCGYSLTSAAGTGRAQVHHYYECVGIQKKVAHPCTIRRVRAKDLEEAVLGVVREAARNPELLNDAAAEAERMAREQVSPLREQLDARRRDFKAAEAEGSKLLDTILAAGVSGSALAKTRLAEVEERIAGLRRSVVELEGQLAARETEHLDLEYLREILAGFDVAFDHLTAAEKREFLQNMISRIVVYEDRIEVGLYDGSQQDRPFDASLDGRSRRAREAARQAVQGAEAATGRDPQDGSQPVRDGSRCWT